MSMLQLVQQLHHHEEPITAVLLTHVRSHDRGDGWYILAGDDGGATSVSFAAAVGRSAGVWHLDQVLQVSSFAVTSLLPLPPTSALAPLAPPKVFCSVAGPE